MACPLLISTASGQRTTNGTSHAITMPTGLIAGDLVLVVFGHDGGTHCDVTSSGTWNLGPSGIQTAAGGRTYWKFYENVALNDALTITSVASEQSSHISVGIRNALSISGAVATGNSTNANPPTLTAGASDYLGIVAASWDAQITASGNALPDYGNFLTLRSTNAGGASTAAAFISVTGATGIAPDHFVSDTEQWAAFSFLASPSIHTLIPSGITTTPRITVPNNNFPIITSITSYSYNKDSGSTHSYPIIGASGTNHLALLSTSGSSITLSTSGWTLVNAGNNGFAKLTMYRKVLDGLETNLEFTASPEGHSVAIMMNFSGSQSYITNTVALTATNPPPLFVDAQQHNSIWVSVCCPQYMGVTSAPENFENFTKAIHPTNANNPPALAVATRELYASGINPGPFGGVQSSGVGYTLKVYPSVNRFFTNIAETSSPTVGNPTVTEEGGTDNLTPSGISSGAPTVGSPPIIQKHVLVANELSSGAPTVGSPTLQQIHNFTATGISSGAPTVGNPSINQTVPLVLTGVDSGAPTVGNPPITQEHDLSLSGVEAGSPTRGSPSLGQTHNLSLSGISSGAPTVGSPTLSQLYILIPSGISSGAPTVGSPSLAQTHILNLSGIIASPVVSTSTLGQIHVLNASGISSGNPTVGNTSLSGQHSVNCSGISSGSPTVGSVTLSQIHNLGTTSINSGAPTVGSPALTQTHNLSLSGISSGAPTVGTPTLAQQGTFIPNELSAGNPTVGNPSLGQTHVLSLSGISSAAPTVGSPTFSQNHIFSVSGVYSSPTVGTPGLTEQSGLIPEITLSAPVVGSPLLGQTHNLQASGIIASPTISGVILSQNHILGGSGIAAGSPTVGTPSLSSLYSLIASGINADSPTVGTPTITQNHLLLNSGISASPVISSPLFGQNHIFGSTSIYCSGVSVGSPSITACVSCSGVGIDSGTPTVGSPPLSQTHNLSINAFSMSPFYLPSFSISVMEAPPSPVIDSIKITGILNEGVRVNGVFYTEKITGQITLIKIGAR